MILKTVILSSALLALTANVGMAAESIQNSSCSINGIVSGGGIYDAQSDKEPGGGLVPYDTPKWYAGFGEAALALNCDTWNFQADTALYNFTGSETSVANTLTFGSRQAHLGGAAFWRDPNTAAFGLSGSMLFLQDSKTNTLPAFLNATKSTAMARVGAFAEYYVSSQFTVGASGYYLWGKTPNTEYNDGTGFEFEQKSIELAVTAKYYPSNNVAISARADYTAGQRSLPDPAEFINIKNHGYAASLNAEYLIPETALSIFAEGRYANRYSEFPATPVGHNEIVDLQAIVGFKFAFGQNSFTSLAQRDRNSAFDNTSVFMEKLPSLQASESRYYWVKD